MKHAEGNPEDLKKKFWKSLADSPFLFLQLTDDSSTAVPMSPQLDKDANSSIWFFTHTKSDFARLGSATATFEGKGHDMFARFNGTLVKETSQERFDQFWNNFIEAWYDGGKTDPDILFLRMDLGEAEIWDGDMGLLNTAKMALGMTVHEEAEEQPRQATRRSLIPTATESKRAASPRRPFLYRRIESFGLRRLDRNRRLDSGNIVDHLDNARPRWLRLRL